MRTIAIANQKGGCGKTTTAVNISAALAELGNRVLIIDLDPQGHATLGLGLNPGNLDKTIGDALSKVRTPLAEGITKTNVQGLNLVPSNILLSGVELQLAGLYGREYILSQQLSTLNDRYDICIIDCSPSLSLLTLNALVASTEVLVPVQVHYYALEGLKQLLKTISIVKKRFNPRLKLLGILLTLVESRMLMSRQIQRQMRKFFGKMVFDVVIHRTIRLAEAPSTGQSVLTYAPNCMGALEYRALAEEISNGK